MKRMLMALLIYSLALPTYSKEQERALKLQDLALPSAQNSAAEFTDQQLERRIVMLERHKMMGHVTMGLMLASFASALWGVKKIDDDRAARGGLKSKDDASNMNLHLGISALTLASYYTTAYYALAAPKPADFEDSAARHAHKGLAWIHGTAMVLAPILGLLAFKDYHDGKDPSGLAKLHRPVMMAGFGAFAAAYGIAVYNW